MPTAADNLKPGASSDEIQDAVSRCVSEMSDKHSDWDNKRLVAACYSMARKATGKTLAPKE